MEHLDRAQMPIPQGVASVKIPTVEKFCLSNGIPVFSINSGNQEVLRIDLVFEAGLWQQQKPLIATLSCAMLNEGTSKYSATQLAKHFDFYGAYLKLGTGKHTTSVSLYALNKHLPQTLPVFEDLLKRSIFPEDGFQELLQKRRQDFAVALKKIETIAFRQFNELLFGEEHPYGRINRMEDYKKLSRDDVYKFYLSYYIPSNCKIIISGNVHEAVPKLLEKHFGQKRWRDESCCPEVLAYCPVGEQIYLKGRELFLRNFDAKQSALRVGNISVNQNHPDFSRLRVVNTLLGGYFGSRLMKKLREEKGYTYGVGSMLISAPRAAGFLVSTEVGIDVGARALRLIYDEIDRLSQELVSEDELGRVRNYMLGEALRFFDGPFSVGDLLRGYLNYNKELSDYNKDIEAIHAITPQEVQSLSQKYFDTADFIEVVVGKK